MDIKKLSNSISVADQINENDLATIVKIGFKSLICNRPDGEAQTSQASKKLSMQLNR